MLTATARDVWQHTRALQTMRATAGAAKGAVVPTKITDILPPMDWQVFEPQARCKLRRGLRNNPIPHLLCKGEYLPLINSSKLCVDLEVLLIQGLQRDTCSFETGPKTPHSSCVQPLSPRICAASARALLPGEGRELS